MVEFGLKLEDNKVDKWSTKYIDYEKLKSILKRAKSGYEYRDELISRMPAAVVTEVTAERERKKKESAVSLLSGVSGISGGGAGGVPLEMAVPKLSSNSLPNTAAMLTTATTTAALETTTNKNNNNEGGKVVKDKDDTQVINDTTPLLTNPPEIHNVTLTRENSFNSLSGMSGINRTVFKVTSYLGFASEKAMLHQAYEDADDKLSLFQRTYNEEVHKVQEFYADKLRDVSERMEALRADTSFLEESVQRKKLRKKEKKEMERKKGVVEKMKARFGSLVQHHITTSDEESLDEEQMELLHTMTSATSGDEFETPTKNNKSGGGNNKNDEESLRRKMDELSIKRAMDDIYRTATLLHNYSIMNYTGFVKIAKKFDKTFKEHKGLFKGINCDDGKQAQVLASKMERMYADWFCDGDMREAHAQMLSKRGDGLMMDWTQLRLGYRLGMCCILALWVAWDCVWGQLKRGEVSIGGRSAFPVFRACFGLLAWHWFWGFSVYIWTRYRINYIYLFEFDPRNVDTPIDIFNDAVDETLVYLICTLLYYKTDSDDQIFEDLIPPGAYPLFLILYAIKRLIFPWKLRKPLWISIRQVLLATFVSPTFFLTYVGDVFTR